MPCSLPVVSICSFQFQSDKKKCQKFVVGVEEEEEEEVRGEEEEEVVEEEEEDERNRRRDR